MAIQISDYERGLVSYNPCPGLTLSAMEKESGGALKCGLMPFKVYWTIKQPGA